MDQKNIFINDNEDRLGGLEGRYRHSWVEDSFSIEENTGRHIPLSSTNSYIGHSIDAKKIKSFWYVILVGISFLLAKILYLQILKGDEFRNLAEGNRIRLQPIIAERGIIYDRFGEQLVQNVPSFSLAVVPQDFPKNLGQRQTIIEKLSEISGLTIDEINALLKKYRNYSYDALVLKENLDYETALKLYVKNSSLPGVVIRSGTKRDYVFTHQAKPEPISSWSHILGYTGKLNEKELTANKDKGYLLADSIGKTGIERQYEDELRGVYGKKKVEVDAYGKELNIIAEDPPTPGFNLFLTIDNEAQKKLNELVKLQSEKMGGKKIGAIAMNPNNGEIMAMVSWPSYDNNLFSGGIKTDDYKKIIEDNNRPLFDRVIGGSYPSGSIVKLVVAAAALEEKILTPQTIIMSVGGIYVSTWHFVDWKVGGHGATNLNKAIAWSINTYFYYIGGGYKDFVGLGVDRIEKYMYKFNLGRVTGIDLPGESAGFIPSRDWKKNSKNEMWYIGDTYNLSIGQGDLLVTPLQAAEWTAAIANGGNLVTPHLGKKLESAKGDKNIDLTPPIKEKNIVSASTANAVREAARECVLTGSCYLLRTLPFSSGGKTGTAQWSSTKKTHGWFTSFAPYEKPQIVVTALVEEVGEGVYSAMPIVNEFLKWWGQKYLTR